MLSVRRSAVELVGGPFDGQCRQLPPRPEELEPFLALPVNAASLAGREPQPNAPDSGVAIYELEAGEEISRYRFLCVTAASRDLLHGWLL